MNELLKINYETEQPTVSARDLHEKLEISKRFSVWFETNSKGFVEGQDYTSVLSGTVVNNGASGAETKSNVHAKEEFAKFNFSEDDIKELTKQIERYRSYWLEHHLGNRGR